MAKPRGPEKKLIALRVALPTHEWLTNKAGDRPVPTYLAEQLEQQAGNSAKSKKAREVATRFKGKK
jgi:hypothetical protein